MTPCSRPIKKFVKVLTLNKRLKSAAAWRKKKASINLSKSDEIFSKASDLPPASDAKIKALELANRYGRNGKNHFNKHLTLSKAIG